MEYRWNINTIKRIIFNSKIIYIASNDEAAKKDSSLNVFQAETALSFLDDISYTSYSEQDETTKFINNRKQKNIQDLTCKSDILNTFKYNDYLDVHRIHQTGTKVSSSQTISLVKNSSIFKRRLLNNLIKGQQLLFTSDNVDAPKEDDGTVIYIYNIKYPLVFVRKSETYYDAISLTHELGHVEQHLNTKADYQSFTNQQSSSLKEIISILSELKLINYFKGKIDEQDRLSLLSDTLLFYKKEGTKLLQGKKDYIEYLVSGLIAIYFYQLSKTNIFKYTELINKYYLLAPTHSDIEILDLLGITLNKVDEAFEIYYQKYQEDVSKIKKYI